MKKLLLAVLAAGLLGAVPPARALNHAQQARRHVHQQRVDQRSGPEEFRDTLDDKFGEFGDHMHRKFGKFGDDLHDWWNDVKPW